MTSNPHDDLRLIRQTDAGWEYWGTYNRRWCPMTNKPLTKPEALAKAASWFYQCDPANITIEP